MTTDQTSTPPADYKPAPWVALFSKVQLQWFAEQLHQRQQTARTDERESRNRATLAESRLSVLEARKETP